MSGQESKVVLYSDLINAITMGKIGTLSSFFY